MQVLPGQPQHAPHRRSTLRRWIAPIACLLIGMVLSIVSAWVCIAIGRFQFSQTPELDAQWLAVVPAEWPQRPYRRSVHIGLGWSATVQQGESYVVNGEFVEPSVDYVTAGWPIQAMSYTAVHTLTLHTGSITQDLVAFNGLHVPRWLLGKLPAHFCHVPVVPLFPGFVLNTLIYAALSWCILFAPGYLRRRRRLARNQCPACGYPVGISTTCSECGAPVGTMHST